MIDSWEWYENDSSRGLLLLSRWHWPKIWISVLYNRLTLIWNSSKSRTPYFCIRYDSAGLRRLVHASSGSVNWSTHGRGKFKTHHHCFNSNIQVPLGHRESLVHTSNIASSGTLPWWRQKIFEIGLMRLITGSYIVLNSNVVCLGLA